MAPSIANIPDHYLWLGLGVFTFVAIQQVSHSLKHIRSVTEIRHSPPPRPHHPSNPTHQEDAIKTSSLLTLATSPNIDIRTSATKILCQRFFASNSAKKLWERDLQSTNAEVKHRAQLVYNLLCEHDVGLPIPRERWRIHQPSIPTYLPRGESDTQDLRRRRREAVVIHDGDVDRPIGQEDLYMRDEDGDLERRFQALAEWTPPSPPLASEIREA